MTSTDAAVIRGLLGGQPTQRQPTRRSQPSSMANPLDTLVKAVSGMDPLTQKLAVGYIRDINPAFRSIALTESEQEMQALRLEAERADLRKRISRGRVENTVAFLMQNRGKKASKTGMTLEEYAGIGPLDQSLFENSDNLLHASKAAAQFFGRRDLALDEGDMVLSGFEGLRQGRIDRERDRLRDEVAAEQTATKRLEQRAMAAEGEGATASAIAAAMQNAEEARGSSFIGTFDSEIDEPRGSDEFRRAGVGAVTDVPRQTGASGSAAVEAFIGRYGDEIKDQLEGLGTNERGELVIGQGDIGVAPEAVTNLALMIDDLSRIAGVDAAVLMRQMGLEYAGIDQGSLTQARILDFQHRQGGLE